MLCEFCKQEHDGKYGSGRFCCSTCSRKFSRNSDKDYNKKVNCNDCGKIMVLNKRASSLLSKCDECRSRPKGIKGKSKCINCKTYFDTTRKKTCSSKCAEIVLKNYRKAQIKRITEFRRKLKSKAINYKGGKCIVCKYDKCVRSLGFHHVDPSQKDFNISGKNIKSWERMKAELKKCVLLCSNCHGEVHEGLIDLKDYAPQFFTPSPA